MKRIIWLFLIVAILAPSADALNFGAEYYRTHKQSLLAGTYQRDPLWLFMNETEGNLGGNVGTGNVWYVNSNVASEGNGKSWLAAKDTLNEVIDLADANDTIYIAQGHTEAMGAAADEVDIDVDGLTIEQVGSNIISNGFDYTGVTTGAFAISGDNITLINIRFHANIPDVMEAIDLEANATGVRFLGCLFDSETPGTDEFFRCVKQDGANVNQLEVIGCEFRMGAGAAECAIDLIDSDYAKIVGNLFEGDYSVADVNNATTASIHILITDNVIINGTVGGNAGLNTEPCIELKSDTSGVIIGNYLVCNEATPDAAIVGADMWVMDNFYTETEGGVSAAPMWLTTDTLDNKIGVDDSSNLGTTSSVTADSDGSILERLEQIDVDTSATATSATAVALVDPNFVSYDAPRILADTTSAMTAGNGYGAADDPVIFTVTGDILCRASATFSTQVTSTSNDTLELGIAGQTAILLVQDAVDGTAFDVGDVWTLTIAPDANGSVWLPDDWIIISNSADIVLTIDDHDLTAGVTTFFLQWVPMSADAAVVGAAP